MRKSKWVVFKYMPYEYKALEEYLESMALRGWKLESIYGFYIRFKKIEPQPIKYSVDIMNSVSFFNGKNSKNVLEYREYCKEAGWEFVCEREKFQVYCSMGSAERVPIHTDESENIKNVFKASLKYILYDLLVVGVLLWSQYNSMFINKSANFLASNFSLISLFILGVLALSEVIEIFNFLLWLLNSKFSITNGSSNKLTILKAYIHRSGVFAAIFMIVFSIILGEIFMLKMLGLNLVLMYVLYKVKNLVEASKLRRKRSINIIAYVAICIISLFALNIIMITDNSKDRNYEEHNYIMTLDDFNDKPDGEHYLYINDDNSILASRIYYSSHGENINLSYELFESKYDWIINYKFQCIKDELNKFGIDLIEINTSLPGSVKVYKNDRNNELYLLLDDKVLEIHYIETYNNEDELLQKVYEKLA